MRAFQAKNNSHLVPEAFIDQPNPKRPTNPKKTKKTIQERPKLLFFLLDTFLVPKYSIGYYDSKIPTTSALKKIAIYSAKSFLLQDKYQTKSGSSNGFLMKLMARTLWLSVV